MVHREESNKKFKILIVTVSTSRTEKTDTSGNSLRLLFLNDSHEVDRVVCSDDEEQILDSFYSHANYDIFVFVGGTGPSRRDVTIESIRSISEKEMVGFGELFRSESHERFAYLSNASLFIKDGKQIYCVPGSPDATVLAFSTISSIMGHVDHEIHKE